MTTRIAIAALALSLCAVPAAVSRAALDGSEPFLCAVVEAVECTSDGTCIRGGAEQVGMPTFFWVDVPAKRLREHMGERKTPILRHERKNGALILQGVEQRAWSASISEETGQLTASAAGAEEGFMLFGSCTVIPR